MDPGTFDEKQLKETLALGVNRVSLGVQSFDQVI
jgi:coproporphyrinogen III oxidase-like Fe-S oxidoreductase